ncbi:c-type cytochrome biogenesis protein CcmI [Rhizobium cremeum]|uniref:c-type cytochrome biogenesis protein CcmI n=1 Tax=Rhizobium cremeum TaxID=2813827 RepID=UPI001FD180C3|nr:c-type cytochrome biogenesis protein CcmI [Rhizobium cremeum]MCJ7996042.1 c-type cytochrome biogenesis protein CcmI [Rhizobium cremeum]MCJ8001301.1 c-type cytochrome biogenesis protein CcmI [Rhizobium cremeum]
MLYWIISALLTVAVAVVLLLPLLKESVAEPDDDSGEAAVYRDQLRELERDKGLGLISTEDADYARAEIGRRLLSVSAGKPQADAAKAVRKSHHPLAQAFVILCLPAIGLGLYLLTGSPGTPSAPLAERLENPGNNLELLVAKAERHLAENPNDGAGWDVLAPIYFKSERIGDAELAYRNAIRFLGPNPARMSGLGEVLVAGNGGIVTEDARSAFEEALRLDANNPRAEFYLALALEQGGKRAEAKAAFEKLLAASPKQAPWVPLVSQHIAANSGEVPAAAPAAPGNPTEAEVAAAQDMSAGDRMAMIRGMVESLDAKLKQDPKNFEGWMRLVRSYAMLKEPERAVGALKDGLATFPADGAEGKQLIAMARELGLPVEEALK